MTDYDPFNDFWGDFITAIGVVVIATRLSEQAANGNVNGANGNRGKKIEAVDDIIIIGSLHALNIYLFFAWWDYEDGTSKALGLIGLILSIIFLFYVLLFHFRETNAGLLLQIRDKINKYRLILILNILFCTVNPNLDIGSYDEFCNMYPYGHCEIDRILRFINITCIIVAWILSLINSCIDPSYLYYIQRFLTLLFFICAILVQAVGNGYLLSSNLLQTKFTTALATVAVTRLLDVYSKGGSSIFAPIFELK
ncbi:unnamed protein product [Rhizophagus irregularis]|nr:unnamed protein product [Rhizophagus irregularis]